MGAAILYYAGSDLLVVHCESNLLVNWDRFVVWGRCYLELDLTMTMCAYLNFWIWRELDQFWWEASLPWPTMFELNLSQEVSLLAGPTGVLVCSRFHRIILPNSWLDGANHKFTNRISWVQGRSWSKIQFIELLRFRLSAAIPVLRLSLASWSGFFIIGFN